MNESHLQFYKRWTRFSRPYFKWQLEQFTPYLGKRIGDIGCGLGEFCEFLKNKELYLGFEPDPEMAAEFNKLQKHNNIKLAVHGDITTEKAAGEMRKNFLDTIICINVLEHIYDDKLALSNMLKGVVCGGHICILVPALPWLYGTLDHLDNHYRRYSKRELLKSVKEVMHEKAEVLRCYYLNFIGALGWFLKSRILQEKTHANENFIIMNRLLPVVGRIESIVKPPFGLSLILVIRKNAK